MSSTDFPGNRPLKEVDPVIFKLIEDERERQRTGLELIASENITSGAVIEALGSELTNKYSEGQPGRRYYGGNEVVDKVELLCMERALTAFHLSAEDWGVNVQPYSGSSANFEALTAVLNPGDTVLGLSLNAGGHLTHGHQSATKKISGTAIYFNAVQYGVDAEGLINYEEVEKMTAEHKPRVIICGASAYPREWDYARFRAIADSVGAILMCDMAHISGLVAAQEAEDPFAHCHLVTTTTHKSLRGPRSAMIFYSLKEYEFEGVKYDFKSRVNFAVFPSLQGGPHEHQIAAVAVALLEAQSPSFKVYQQQVKKNMVALCDELQKLGYTIQTGGTSNHLCLLNVKEKGLTGSKVEKVCDIAHITVNKNMIVTDTSALAPGGIRLGSGALTSRNMVEEDFKKVASFLDRVVKICVRIQEQTGKKLKDFNPVAETDEEVLALRKEVNDFSSTFPIPGRTSM